MTSHKATEMIALATNIIDAAFCAPPKSYKAQGERRQLMIEILADCIETHLRTAGRPDAGYAVKWSTLSGDTSWIDGRDVVLLARDMEVTARYCPGEWSEATPDHPREYNGAVWSCFDDAFQFEIEECSKDPSEWIHDGATHWRLPVALIEQPATSEDYEHGKLYVFDATSRTFDPCVQLATPGYAAGFEACREALGKQLVPESGVNYGMATDAERRQIREHNRTVQKCLSALPTPAPAADDDSEDDDLSAADVWEAYCDEVPAKKRSPQGALAFGFVAALASAPTAEDVTVEELARSIAFMEWPRASDTERVRWVDVHWRRYANEAEHLLSRFHITAKAKEEN